MPAAPRTAIARGERSKSAAARSARPHSLVRSRPRATCSAESEEEHAVSTTRLGPRSPATYARRPAAIDCAPPVPAYGAPPPPPATLSTTHAPHSLLHSPTTVAVPAAKLSSSGRRGQRLAGPSLPAELSPPAPTAAAAAAAPWSDGPSSGTMPLSWSASAASSSKSRWCGSMPRASAAHMPKKAGSKPSGLCEESKKPPCPCHPTGARLIASVPPQSTRPKPWTSPPGPGVRQLTPTSAIRARVHPPRRNGASAAVGATAAATAASGAAARLAGWVAVTAWSAASAVRALERVEAQVHHRNVGGDLEAKRAVGRPQHGTEGRLDSADRDGDPSLRWRRLSSSHLASSTWREG
eukprot:scaffold91262_cov69-Phaeocystis_antarctica.AAC.3